MGKTSAEQHTYDKQVLSRYMLDFVIYLMQIVSISLESVTFWKSTWWILQYAVAQCDFNMRIEFEG